MAQDIVNSMLHAQGIDPLDQIDDDPSDSCSDLAGDPESAEPSPAAEKSNKKTELLKKTEISSLCTRRGKLGEINTTRKRQTTAPKLINYSRV